MDSMTMEHITAIQELVDLHKQEMPTGVAAALMRKCQEAYDKQPKLYRLICAIVGKNTSGDLAHDTTEFIVEAVDAPEHQNYIDKTHRPHRCLSHVEMPYHGLVPEQWLQKSMPFVIEKEELYGTAQ